MLTVIAMVHRDRVKLPDRRAELYAEAVDVLLGKRDEARGVQEGPLLDDRVFDLGDKRLVLQALALTMHEYELKEIGVKGLRGVLSEQFSQNLGDQQKVAKAVDRFVKTIEERSGLLVSRGEGMYGFSHLTFQEYLAALAVADRDDYVEYTLSRLAEPWWREVILLEAGLLSIQGKERATRLIQAIIDHPHEDEPFHNLVLAAECLRDVGSSRVLGDPGSAIQRRLRQELSFVPPRGKFRFLMTFLTRGMTPKTIVGRRTAAVRALARIGGDRYWSLPHGEPEWVSVPAGEFWMGCDNQVDCEKPRHKLHLEDFLISRLPVTHAQYHFFTQAEAYRPPFDWEDARPPRGKENHPVTVSWHDAMAYCRWLSKVTGKTVTLPSEAQWEKAARGDQDSRIYPWGDTFDATRCNSKELDLGDTTPVGIFPDGASPYGCLDMAGNVWEWTRSLWGKVLKPDFRYPYKPGDGREDLEAPDEILRVLRGGSFLDSSKYVRCLARDGFYPYDGDRDFGFRVVASPFSVL